MKKRLLLIPLISAFALSGCDFMDTVKGWFSPKTDDKSTPDGKKDKGGDDDIPELIIDDTPKVKEEYNGYRLAKEIQEGKRYLLGAYRHNSDTMRFFNGDYHRDGQGFYPYYLGTDENSVETAAQIEIHFVDGSTTDFYIQVFTPDDTTKVYNEKYLGIYTGTTDRENIVTSIALLDSPDQTTYHDPKKDTDHDDVCSTFTFIKKYTKETAEGNKEVDMNAPCMWFTKAGDLSQNLIFMGTTINSNNYTSFDTQSVETASNGAAYDLAHFYEAIEA